jgi:peptidase C25-like protein
VADVGAQGVATARTTLLDGLKEGPKTTSYFGHGGEDVWSDQGLLRNADVSGLEGAGEETVLFSWTCETQWYLGDGRSISEELLLVPNGGSVASVGPVGISDPALQVNLSRRVYDYFLAGKTIGEAVRRAKADALSEDPGLAPVVHGFSLLGDPALTLGR